MVPLILVLSFLIGIGYLILIRSFDRYEKDSLFKLIIAFLIGGIIAVVITTVIYSGVEVQQNFKDAIFKIGTIEELSKMLGFLAIFLLFRKSINEIVDGLIYISAVALGFACIENVFYALSSSEPVMLLLQRAIYAVAGHLSFAGYMGIALFINFKVKLNLPGIIISFILAALAHGLYDGVLFEHRLNDLFHYIFILLVAAHIFLYRIVLSYSKFRPIVDIHLFQRSSETKAHHCLICSCERDSFQLSYHKIEGTECNTCHSITLNFNNWIRLNKYFRPIINSRRYGRFVLAEYGNKGCVEMGKESGIFYDSDSKSFTAKSGSLRSWIIDHNKQDQAGILKIPIIGILLKYLGIRFLKP